MDAKNLLINLVVGILCGLLGQAIRIAVGIKKTNDEAVAQKTTVAQIFDWSQLTVSLFLGGAAGGAATLAYLYSGKGLDQSTVGPLIAAGYAGADFLEGMITNSATAMSGGLQTPGNANPSTPKPASDPAPASATANPPAPGLPGLPG